MTIFRSFANIDGQMQERTEDEIKAEPMLFGCDAATAARIGGPITQEFLSHFEYLDEDYIFDSRTHMLMPGWYPCIPGWHHDDVARGDDGQPDYLTAPRTAHALVTLGTALAPTQFALGHNEVSIIQAGEVAYGKWTHEVQRDVDAGHLTVFTPKPGQIVWFDDRTWHQGSPCTVGGWRWFGRVSFGSSRKPINEIRQQVQVYLPNDGLGGW